MLTSTVAALAALAAVAHGQSAATSGTVTSSASPPASTAAIPACALTCVLSSLPNTPCAQFGVGNITCICTSSEFQLAYFKCQQSTCSESDLNAAEQYGAQTCKSNGTPININTTPSGFSSSAAASTANQTSAGASSTRSSAAPVASSTAAVSSSAAPHASASGTTGAPAAGASGKSNGERTVVGALVGAVAALAGLAIVA
ncbi:hypothetical protein JCM3770_003277 [Rhodotorula araucariae]